MSEEMGVLAHSMGVASGLDINSITVNTLDALELACTQPVDLLLSFGTGVIVPKHILDLPSIVALNIHAASPKFPGRDPHHFAVYYGAKEYGATIHYMIDKVDHGQIVDVETFEVAQGTSAAILLWQANEAAIELMRRFFNNYAAKGAPASRNDVTWAEHKSTRNEFLELCRVSCDMPEAEFSRRLVSTTMPGHNNLYVDIHGYRFRLEGKLE
jgi:methionyl-tRNA formyltransferase